jgi:hypothetical protein
MVTLWGISGRRAEEDVPTRITHSGAINWLPAAAHVATGGRKVPIAVTGSRDCALAAEASTPVIHGAAESRLLIAGGERVGSY